MLRHSLVGAGREDFDFFTVIIHDSFLLNVGNINMQEIYSPTGRMIYKWGCGWRRCSGGAMQVNGGRVSVMEQRLACT